MNQIWIIVAAVVALMVVTRIRARRRMAKFDRPPSTGPRIQGSQVVASLHPQVGAACLLDHGLQFGRGFRRKEGPALPHDANCRCEIVPFSFSSSEVFNGALRGVADVRSGSTGLEPAEANRLLARLKEVDVQPLPADAAGYLAAVGVEQFPVSAQAGLESFLTERYAHLREQAASASQQSQAASEPAPEPRQSTEPT